MNPMQRFYHFINRNFPILFWPVLAAAFFVAFIQLKDKVILTNDVAHHGIVSLELSRTSARDSAIIYSWKKDTLDHHAPEICRDVPRPIHRLEIARFDVLLDYLFILLYTALGIIIIATLQTRIKKEATAFSNLLLALAVLAGLSDSIENLGLLSAIRTGMNGGTSFSDAYPYVTSLAASIKFLILAMLLFIYLPYVLIWKDDAFRTLSEYVKAKSVQLFRYRVILAGVLIFSLPIWIMNQGQDLLINSNSGDLGVALFLLVVVIAAILNWYLSKLFFEPEYHKPLYPFREPELADPVMEASEKKVSRFLGTATIIIPAVAILNAMNAIQEPFPFDFFPPAIWLLALLGLFFVLIKFDLAAKYYQQQQKNGKGSRIRLQTMTLIILLAVVIPTILRFLVLGKASDTPQSLFYLFLHLVSLAFSFYIFVSTRSYMFAGDSWLGKMIGWPVTLSGGLLAILFVLLNFFPTTVVHIDKPFLSLPVLQSGIIFYILAFTLLMRASLSLKINLVLFLFLAGLIISITAVNDYHAVEQRTVKARPRNVQLGEYFRQWLLHRKNEVRAGDSVYPIFLVNTYGGGVKAAAFTDMVLTYLDSYMINHGRDSLGFEHYVFSISGASGGTIGAAVQCAFRARYPDKDENGRSYRIHYSLDTVEQFYRHDFLTPVLSNMLGRDIWASATSLPLWQDRSGIQECLWEKFGAKSLGIRLDAEFNEIWDTSMHNYARYEVPLLFSNTLNVDDGLKGIMAPVALNHNDFPATIFIRERIDSLNKQHNPGKDSMQSVSLMTGAFLSARFPFISPSGKMGPGYHFMDGGGKDNSGASTSEEIFIKLAGYLDSLKQTETDTAFCALLNKVRFCFVSISNSPYFDPNSNRRLAANRFELISPLIGIINSGIDGNARAADSALRFRYTKAAPGQFPGVGAGYSSVWITATCINEENGNKRPYSPVLPLGWQISEPSLQRLRESFSEDMISKYDTPGIRNIQAILKQQIKI